MKIECHYVSPMRTNCYLIWNEDTKELLVVDPGSCKDAIFKHVEELGLTPVAILLTHGHFDHMMGVDGWKKAYPGIPVYIGKDEEEVLKDTDKNLTTRFRQYAVSFDADVYLEDEEVIELIGKKIKYLLTPGHTIGSGCYYFEEDAVLISGDTLFRRSMGRTDMPTGDAIKMVASLQRLAKLPPEVRVLPGHEAATTIEDEVAHNPYIRR